ncbi:MAG: hypothetical protein ACOVNU_03050 [Candidatus Kapaibacteriota bacterium]
MSNNHNSQEYNAVFSADNSNVFNNETDNYLYEGKQRFINATSLDEKFQAVQKLHLLMIKAFQNNKENINYLSLENWLKEVTADAARTANSYIDINSFKQYEDYIKFVVHFWGGIVSWLELKKLKGENTPYEYPFFNGNMDCCQYYSEKILVWEHQQILYRQFLYHLLSHNDKIRQAMKQNERNQKWRHNPLNYQ